MLLEGSGLSYWTYPDDEAKKEPVGRIDLAKGSTELVSIFLIISTSIKYYDEKNPTNHIITSGFWNRQTRVSC